MADELIINNAEDANIAAIRKTKATNTRGEQVQRRLATGSLGMGTRYGLDSLQSIAVPTEFKSQVALARDLYVEEGIVKTVIDLMVDFSATKIRNVAISPKSKKFFDNVCKYSDLDSVIRWILLEYYLSGDVYTYRGDKQVVKKGQDSGAVFYPYTVLNPIEIEPEGSLLFNYSIYTMNINNELKTLLSQIVQKKKDVSFILKYIPKEFKNPQITQQGRIVLDTDKVGRICRNKQPYEKRPTPFVSGAFAPLLLKRRLREMDLATAEGTINSLMVIKVGNDTFPASKKQLEALASLFATGAKSYQLFWNHTIDIEIITADLSALDNAKYKQVNMDILSALGMPVVLINGGDEGGRFANAWASIVALIERLENARRQVKRWLEEEYRKIAEENNIREVPTVEFDRMNLREEKVFKNILMAYYDRGLLDVETTLEDSDYDYEQIKARKIEHRKDKYIFEPPYSAVPKPPKPKTVDDGGEGRPTTEVSPKYTDREPMEGPKQTGEPEERRKEE